MNITLISRFFDARNGGIGSHSSLIYEGLKNKCNLNSISQEDSILPLDYYSYLLFSSIEIKFLLRNYKDTDVFHALSPIESLHINKRKSVASILDLIPLLDESNSIRSKILKSYFSKAINEAIKCERLILNNNDLLNYLELHYNVDKNNMEVIPPPISSNLYPMNTKNDTFTVGTISCLTERKRIDILLKSFLEANIENSKLLIGGHGSELDNLKKIANNDERVEFLGFISEKNMNDFYNSLDVFVFPTLIEGYGMPIVEAMACGKPVITLEDGNIPSDLKNRTFITNKNDLANVLKNRKFKCNIKDNIEFYKEHSKEKVSNKLLKVYESI